MFYFFFSPLFMPINLSIRSIYIFFSHSFPPPSVYLFLSPLPSCLFFLQTPPRFSPPLDDGRVFSRLHRVTRDRRQRQKQKRGNENRFVDPPVFSFLFIPKGEKHNEIQLTIFVRLSLSPLLSINIALTLRWCSLACCCCTACLRHDNPIKGKRREDCATIVGMIKFRGKHCCRIGTKRKELLICQAVTTAYSIFVFHWIS